MRGSFAEACVFKQLKLNMWGYFYETLYFRQITLTIALFGRRSQQGYQVCRPMQIEEQTPLKYQYQL